MYQFESTSNWMYQTRFFNVFLQAVITVLCNTWSFMKLPLPHTQSIEECLLLNMDQSNTFSLCGYIRSVPCDGLNPIWPPYSCDPNCISCFYSAPHTVEEKWQPSTQLSRSGDHGTPPADNCRWEQANYRGKFSYLSNHWYEACDL